MVRFNRLSALVFLSAYLISSYFFNYDNAQSLNALLFRLDFGLICTIGWGFLCYYLFPPLPKPRYIKLCQACHHQFHPHELYAHHQRLCSDCYDDIRKKL